MKKYRIAFIKYAGLSAGGTERWLQMMAAHADKDKFDVDYYYCDASPYLNNDYKHPNTDPYRKQYMQDHGINLIQFHVKYKNASEFYSPWIETDFWDVFDEKKYDLVQTAKAGNPEYPYIFLKNSKVVEYVTLAGGVDLTENIKKSIHLSKWQLTEWLKSGGNINKADIIPIPVENSMSTDNFREELKIDNDIVICGFHQRDENTIFSPMQLEAYKYIETEKTYMLVLGGGDKYKEQAKKLNISNIHFLPHSGDSKIIDKFLNTIDIFTHGRADGETFGTVFAEAMIHKKPCLSHTVSYPGANAMSETIGPSGFVANDIYEYRNYLKILIDDKALRDQLGRQGYDHAINNYTIQACIEKLQNIWLSVLENGINLPSIDNLKYHREWKDYKMYGKNILKLLIANYKSAINAV